MRAILELPLQMNCWPAKVIIRHPTLEKRNWTVENSSFGTLCFPIRIFPGSASVSPSVSKTNHFFDALIRISVTPPGFFHFFIHYPRFRRTFGPPSPGTKSCRASGVLFEAACNGVNMPADPKTGDPQNSVPRDCLCPLPRPQAARV